MVNVCIWDMWGSAKAGFKVLYLEDQSAAMHGTTESLQLNSHLLECWGRERGSYQGEQLEEGLGLCNIEGFFSMCVPSERKIPMDQPLRWIGGMVTVLEMLHYQQFP